MKTAEEYITELQDEIGMCFCDCVEDNKEKVIQMVKDYAYSVITDAIEQTEICCNNFHPTITLLQLVDIKNNLP